jgi:hypothetical protein
MSASKLGVNLKKIFLFLRNLTVITIITLVLLEFVLRIFPQMIPPVLLIHFNPKMRKQIAKGRFLTVSDTFEYARDDFGPPLRLLKPFTMQSWRNTDERGDIYRAQLDEIGFCNSPETYSRTSVVDIVTIGDSFTWCTAVKPEATWTSQLGRLSGASTLNLGRGGVGPYEYLQILKGYGIQKKPKIVILTIYEGNDLRDVLKYQDYRNNIRRLPDHSAIPPKSETRVISRYSYSYNLMRSFLKYLRHSPLSANDEVDLQADGVNFRYNINFPDRSIQFNGENTDRDEVRHARGLRAKEIDLQVFGDALKSFVQLSRQNQFIPVILYMPSAHTTYAANTVFDDRDLSILMPWFSLEQRNFFKIQGQKLGYKFIDLTPSLQSSAILAGSYNLLYYRLNLHLTNYGHKIVAETVLQNMRSMHLLQ